MAPEVDDDPQVEPPAPGPPTQDYDRADHKRTELASFLARQRNIV
jgi:hypothetical protein